MNALASLDVVAQPERNEWKERRLRYYTTTIKSLAVVNGAGLSSSHPRRNGSNDSNLFVCILFVSFIFWVLFVFKTEKIKEKESDERRPFSWAQHFTHRVGR